METDFLKKPVGEALRLSVRARNALDRIGVETVQALTELAPEDILTMPNCGVSTLREIRQELMRYGLRLGSNNAAGDLTSARARQARIDETARAILVAMYASCEENIDRCVQPYFDLSYTIALALESARTRSLESAREREGGKDGK